MLNNVVCLADSPDRLKYTNDFSIYVIQNQCKSALTVKLTSGTRFNIITLLMWGRGGMADAADSKSADLKSCGFKSRRPHHLY